MSKMSIKVFDVKKFSNKVLEKCQFSRKSYYIMDSEQNFGSKMSGKN